MDLRRPACYSEASRFPTTSISSSRKKAKWKYENLEKLEKSLELILRLEIRQKSIRILILSLLSESFAYLFCKFYGIHRRIAIFKILQIKKKKILD